MGCCEREGTCGITAYKPGREPWVIQPGWQIAVATRTPLLFRARQLLRKITRR